MNTKRWIVASLVAFIIISVLEYTFHNHCLKTLYEATASLWRPEAEMSKLVPYGMLLHLAVAFLLGYIYARGYQDKSSRLGEGVRFGLILGLFTSLPMAGWSYIAMPVPFQLALYWFLMGMVEFLIVGGVIGLIYKK